MLRHVLIAVFCGYLSVGVVQTQVFAQETEASKFLQSMADEVVDVLANKDVPLEVREEKLLSLVERRFDVEGISKFVLGRFWKTADPEEHKKFVAVFPIFMIKAYSKWFDKYSGQNLQLVGSHEENGKNFIYTYIDLGDQELIKAQWVLHKVDGSMKVIDFQAKGINPRLTWKKEFQSVIQRKGGLGSLVALLEKKVGRASKSF